MRPSIGNKKIPNYLGLLLLVVGVFLTSMLAQSGILFPTQASPASEPQNVIFSNITDTSFTVSYSTAASVPGTVAYGETEEFGEVAFDTRDVQGQTPQSYAYHYITITNLKPSTKYFIAIISDGNENEAALHTVTTGTALAAAPPSQKTVRGKVLTTSGTAPAEGIVHIQGESTGILSTMLQPDGSYSLTLDGLRNAELSAYTPITGETMLDVYIFAQQQKTQVTATVDNAAAMAPVTLAQEYDFTIMDETATTEEASASAETEEDENPFPVYSGKTPLSTEPQILSPKKDESFTDAQPRFTGTAPPGRSVEITINSSHQIKTTVKTDSSGRWTYRPAKPLEPGNHTITITTRDEAGITRTILQSFVVNAQGSQFTEPSVSPEEPTPTPTTRPTSGPTAKPTTQPTTAATSAPTSGPTVAPTTVPTVQPTNTLMPSPTLIIATYMPTQPPIVKPDDPGSEQLFLMLGLTGFAVIVGGMLFFFII